MIGKIIRNWRIKKYLDYFKSDYPTTYKKLVDSKFENEKDRYIYIETLYSFYKSKYDLYKNSINCNYQHDYYNNNIYVFIDLELSNFNYSKSFAINATLIFNKKLNIKDSLLIKSKKWNKTIEVSVNDIDQSFLSWIEGKLTLYVDYSYIVILHQKQKYKDYKNNYNHWGHFPPKKENTNTKPVDKNYERFKKLVFNLKERKRQIDTMDKNDPNYSNLVNEYNTAVRKWRSMKEKYNY
jgi:hypothetical protein